MCGIVGMVGNIHAQHQKMFRDMLLFDVVRGMDSTGVVAVPLQMKDEDKPAVYEKDVGLPDELWRHQGVSDLFDNKGYLKGYQQAVIGHNRAATVGKVNVEGAHPFRFGNILGVHNGTLRNYKDLDGAEKFDVDSMALYNHIEKHGIADAWKNFIGAAALVWWDETDRSLNIIRNAERPLVCAYGEKDDIMFYASESWMITAAAARRNVKLKTEEVTDKEGNKSQRIDIRHFAEHHHYKYRPTNTDYGFVEKTKLEKKTPPPAHYAATTYTNIYSGPKNKSSNKTVKPGFGGKQYETGNAVNKKQINAGWASNMERGDKDTRGLKFTISHEIDGGRQFLGRISSAGHWKGEFITIYPNSLSDLEQLRTALKKGNTTFKTHARLRYKDYGSYRKWGVSSAGIKPVITTVSKEDKAKVATVPVEDEDPIPFNENLFRTYGGTYVDETQWYRLLSPSNCACSWCNSPLDHKEHKEVLFLSKNDALCPECTGDESVIEYVQGMFPGTSGVNYVH